MDEIKINYERTTDVLNEITQYLRSDASTLEQLFSSVSSIEETGAWVCSNAAMLKDYELDRCKELAKHFEALTYNFDKINNNLNSYNDVEKQLINKFEGN